MARVRLMGLALTIAVVVAGLGLYLLNRSDATTSPAGQEGSSATAASNAAPVETVPTTGGFDVSAASGSSAGNCIGAPNSEPGSPDPWGGCWPGPQNTGYPHGVVGDTRTPVALTAYTGPTTIDRCGVVIDSKLVDSTLTITAGNGTHSSDTPCVTIRNSLVKGWIHTDTVDQGPVVISDTEIAIPGEAFWASVGFYNTFAARVNSHGGEAGLKCQAYCGYYDSWVHAAFLRTDLHANSIGSNGIEAGDKIWMNRHNYMSCGELAGRAATLGDAGCSANFGLYGDFAPLKNITIDKNFFAPARQATSEYSSDTQPGYCLQTGMQTRKPFPTVTNLVVTDNVFAKGYTGKCGTYGPDSGWEAGNGNVWKGNTWDDGSALVR